MRHKLLYLLALALTATSSGWGQNGDALVYSSGGKLCKMILPKTPSNPALETISSCFANGNPVRVYLNQTSDRMIVETIETNGGTPDTLQFEPNKFAVFGGSLGKAVASTSITLESGRIRSIFGGGMFVGNAGTGKTTQAVADKYSYKNSDGSSYTPVSADVSDAVSIEIKPGAVVGNLLLGGGRYYAKTNTVNIKADQATIMTIYAGGYDQGETTNTLTTGIDASVNGVKNVNMTLSKCIIPKGLGTGGGQGSTHTGTSVVTVTDSELGAIYGALANGYADDITVNVTNTTFKKQYNGANIKDRELASINRGGVKNVSFIFNDCSFEEPENIVAGLGAVDGWADSDTNGKPLPIVNGNVSYKFINSKTKTPTLSVGRGLDNANIELTGAKASLRSFRDGTAVPEGLSEFTLSAGKTWTFNEGLEMEDGVTFKNNGGSLNIGVSNAKDLQAVLGLVNDKNIGITSVKLNNDLDLSTLSDIMSDIGSFQGIINIKKPLIFDGCGHAIRNDYPNPDASKSYYVVKLDALSAGSTIKNLTIENTNATALDIVTRTNKDGKAVYLNDVTLKNNDGGGLNVNISKVVATNLKTSGNKLAAVRVARDNDANNTHPYFELKGDCKLEEEVKIAYNAKENPSTYAKPALSTTIEERLAMVSIQTNDKNDWKTTWQLAKFRPGDNEFPALSWTNDFDTSSIPGKALAKMTSGAELDSLFTWGGATVDGISWNNTVGDACVSDVKLDKSFAVIGTDSAKCIIQGTWAISPEAKADILLKNLTLTESSTATAATETSMISITKPEVSLHVMNTAITPVAPGNGNGNRRAGIALENGITSSTVQLDETTISLAKNYLVGLYNKGAACSFTMNDSKITSASAENLSGLVAVYLLKDAVKGSTYTINRSELSVGDNMYYTIWSKAPEQNFVINDSNVYGWAAVYMQGAYVENGADKMSLKATNSTFTGVSKQSPSNGFGVIVFEATDNSTVDLTDCKVIAKVEGKDKDDYMMPFLFQVGGANETADRTSLKPCSNCEVRLKNCEVRNLAETTTPVMVLYNNVNSLGDQSGLLNNYMDYRGNKIWVEGETQFLNKDNTASIVVQHGDTVRNAAKTLPEALVYKYKDWITPVAYYNDTVKATMLTKDAALSSLNAAAAIPTGYTLPAGIAILCQDIVMVVGAEEAEAYAAAHPEAVVSVLKQATEGTPLFELVDCSAVLEISADTEWSTAHTGRKVKILDGATLTITAPMDLGTVVMEEGARLVPALSATTTDKITATALQLNASLKDSEWKAFGFPSAYKVQSATEPTTEYTTPTADPKADTGAWYATLKGSTTPDFEYKTDAFGQAGLLAATNGDYQIISTNEPSAPIELKAATEPEAPTTATFTLFANTGTDVLTLTKNEYVYKLDATSNEYVRWGDPTKTLEPFESVILTDETTYSTLRSLRLGNGIVTGTQVIEPTEGYYVTTERGAIVIHTAEATQILIVEMSGRIAYKGMATDGQRIPVPTGIYAVNGQLVRVK